MTYLRYILGASMSIGAAILVWIALVSVHPIFWILGPSGLIAPIVAGICGGFIAGALSSSRKILFATIIGMLLATPLLAFMLRHGWSHSELRPFAFWYWPAWLIPSYLIGGYVSQHYSLRMNSV